MSILDNGVSANGSDGIELDGGTENLIHDNNVAGSSENGLLVDFSNAASNDIARNDVSGHANQQGIWIRGGSGNFIGSNEISGNKNGVRVQTAAGQTTTFGRAEQFVPNTIENNVDDGVHVLADAAMRIGGDATSDGVPDNRIRNNGGEGIDIQSATDGPVTIFNNIISGNGSGGIRVAGTASTSRVEIGGSTARRNGIEDNTPKMRPPRAPTVRDYRAGPGDAP